MAIPPEKNTASISVSQNSKANGSPLNASLSNNGGQATESSVRQLIANGNFRTAVENAKQFHKAQRTIASERLLLDAYAARIQSLLDQNLSQEAKSLIDLVGGRFPSAKERLDGLKLATSARGGELAAVLQPLNDPALDRERRTAIEQIIETQVADLTALAGCAALPPEHSLRQAAAALDKVFNMVTSGPVTEAQIELPEVSRRSPLAPWKLLIRAIACFHRGEDEACREYLAAIKPESVPSRLVPAMGAMLGMKTSATLKPSEAALVSRTREDRSELRAALANLDRALEEESNEARIFKAVRAAVRECQRSAPDRLSQLKQVIAVRGGVEGLDDVRLMAALDGAPRRDARFFRMYARALESSGEPEDCVEACELWEEFRQQAVKEGWFRAAGVEVATLYLHMAEVLEHIPGGLLKEVQRPSGWGRNPAPAEDRYFLFPEKIYQRACVMDPHPEVFSQWMRWAATRSATQAESVAREWHRIRANDMEPLLYLMERAEKRNAIPTSLAYLEKAERIDAVHSVVRAARLRLLAAGAVRHLQQKKPHLATQKLTAMAALPQSQQGGRPAFLAAMRHLICLACGDKGGAAQAHLEVESVLGGGMAAGLLVFGIAAVSKCLDAASLPPVKALSREERTSVPTSLARVLALTRDLGIAKFQLPVSYLAEAEAQFPGVRDSLDVEQLRWLGELGMGFDHPKLAWAASGAGLQRGGPSEAQFMLLRARALPPGYSPRYLALAASALELGRFHRDMEVVDKAVEMVRNPFRGDAVSLTIKQARDVVRKEMASPAFPGRLNLGPDYSDVVPENACQCPDCRRKRGEAFLPFDGMGAGEDDEIDEDKMERIFYENAPEDLPPGLSKMLFELAKDAFLSGEPFEEIVSRILGGGGRGGNKKKGRRKE